MTADLIAPWRRHLPAAFQIAFWGAIAVVLWATLADTGDATRGMSDKALHFAAFYGLAALGRLAYPEVRLRWLGLGLAGLGVAIEALQALPVIHRDASWGDVLADALGAAGALMPVALERLRGRVGRSP